MTRALVLIAAIVCPVMARADMNSRLAQSLTTQEWIARGQESFLRRCSGCHGQQADGNGAAAPMLDPKPRNLQAGNFKFRSTPSGALPTVEDLFRTIDQGIPGTSMPSFREVSEPEKLSIVAFIRSLRPEFKEAPADQPELTLPNPPKAIFAKKDTLIAAAKRGKKTYTASCRSCHGDQGAGDGPSVEGMTDSDDRPIRPANLRLPRLKSGPTAKDVFKALSTGLDGSPMPSYAHLKEAERWDLVAYVFFLRGRQAGIYTDKEELP